MIPLRDDNPTRITPVLNYVLIAACVAVFLWQISLDTGAQRAAVYALGVTPAVLFGTEQLPPDIALVPPAATIVTSMFLHGGWMHLISNMLFLWIFGNNIEDSMGHGRFIVFYLICGVAAAMTQAMPNPDSVVPMIGASGAISGILGAYLLLHPYSRILVLVPLGFFITMMRLPAGLVLGLWFVIQLVQSAMAPAEGGGVAFAAHVGGFVAGVALIPFFKRRNVPFFDRGRHA